MLQAGNLEPTFDLGKAVTAAAIRGEEHEQTKNGANGRMRATLVEDVVFDDDLSLAVKIQSQLFQKSRILLCAFTVNDIRQENHIVISRNRVAPIIAGNNFDSLR